MLDLITSAIVFEPVPVGTAGLLSIAALTLTSAWIGLAVMELSGRRRAREHDRRHAETTQSGADRHVETIRALELRARTLETLIDGQRELRRRTA